MRPSRRLVVLAAAVLPALAIGVSPAAPAVASPAPVVRSCPVDVAPGHATCFALTRTDVAQPASPNAAPEGYGRADLLDAYDLPSTGGAGETVAIVDAYDNPTAASDLAAYRSRYGLPALAAGQFRTIDQRGSTTGRPSFDPGWAAEIALDVDMVTAVCPSCNILLVEADSSSLSDLGTAVNTAVSQGAQYVSNSYGAPSTAEDTADETAYFRHPGVAITASTGDDGYGAQFPATSQYVTAVGGTSLRRSGATRGWTESAWSGAGSGCSSFTARPTFQAGVGTGCLRRAEADVAAVADPDTGVAVYNTSAGGGWTVAGGTSASAPIIAAVYALAGNPGSSPNAAPYAHRSALNDVTTGDNGDCDVAQLCTARGGWDGPTGLGTPIGTTAFAGGTTTSTSTAGRYYPVTPVRVLDTRPSGRPVGSDSTTTLSFAGLLPSRASAVVINLTATNPTADGYLTAYPDGGARPVASSLNKLAGQTRANSVTVALGTGAADQVLAIYNQAGSTDVVVDLLGYYGAGTNDPDAGQAYYPLAQAFRAFDTRQGHGPLGNTVTNDDLSVELGFGLAGVPAVGVSAVLVNLTAVDPVAAGYLKAWDGVSSEPTVSTVNFVGTQTVPNLAVVPVSCLDPDCSDVSVTVGNRISGRTDVVLDVVGFYATPGGAGGSSYTPLVPRRLVDTRSASPFGTLVTGTAGTAGLGTQAAGDSVAANLNVTAISGTMGTYLTLYPGGGDRPPVSNLNPYIGEIAANAAQIQVSSARTFTTYNFTGRIDVAVDLQGVFRPDVLSPGGTPAAGPTVRIARAAS